jgi:hypothetical protein
MCMLRTWIEDVIGRLRLLSSHADGLEDENRKLQAELAGLLGARRENDDTFVLSPPASRSAHSQGRAETVLCIHHSRIAAFLLPNCCYTNSFLLHI